MIAQRKAWGNQIEKGSDLEAAFSTYTIIVMFICAVASTAAAGSYVITRNRMFMYVAIAFFLYFFDLSFIFQAEYLNHGTAITSTRSMRFKTLTSKPSWPAEFWNRSGSQFACTWARRGSCSKCFREQSSLRLISSSHAYFPMAPLSNGCFIQCAKYSSSGAWPI